VTRPCQRAALLAAFCALAAAGSGPACAETLPPDAFAGYSFARVDEVSRHGANLALAFHLFGPVTGFVDTSAHWGGDGSLGSSDFTAMAGPGARFGRPGRTVVFARVVAGLLRDRWSVSVLDVSISESTSRFGLLAGCGVDFPVARRLAIRAQADYLWNDVPPEDEIAGLTSTGFRASAGIVYRFGSAP
jgi:opacity protein-like surface antigen